MPGKWCPSAPNEKTITPIVSASTPTQGDCSKKTAGIIRRGVATKSSKSIQRFKIQRPDAGRTAVATAAEFEFFRTAVPMTPAAPGRPDGQQRTTAGNTDVPSSQSFNLRWFPVLRDDRFRRPNETRNCSQYQSTTGPYGKKVLSAVSLQQCWQDTRKRPTANEPRRTTWARRETWMPWAWPGTWLLLVRTSAVAQPAHYLMSFGSDPSWACPGCRPLALPARRRVAARFDRQFEA